jgi:outer membrane protein assembly factor BamA
MAYQLRLVVVPLLMTIVMVGCRAATTSAQTQLPPAGGSGAPAQSRDADPPGAAGQTPPDQQTDVFDVARKILRKTPPGPASTPAWDFRKLMLAILPTFGYKPSTGFTVGATSNLAKFFGDPKTTTISSAVIGFSVSAKKQTSLTLRFGASGKDNRWRLDGDNRFQWTSQDSYGLGTDTAPADGVNTRFTYVRIYDTAWYELRKSVYAGAGFHYSAHLDVRPGVEGDPAWEDSDYVAYSDENGFDLDGQSSTGFSLNLMLDTRDSPINAYRGWLASVSYRPFVRSHLGGDSAWQETSFDVRSYFRVTKDARQRLAFWAYGDFVASGVAPYFDLPALGMDTYGRSGRGYTEGRFRGERLMYGELEYRAALTRNGLLGMVAFVNTVTLSNTQTDEKLFDSFAPAGGIGLRVLFNKRSRTNLCIDCGWGRQGAKGLYLGLQEAF